jgi:lipoprotein-anchoring transpeptidase ErfK/SrfK
MRRIMGAPLRRQLRRYGLWALGLSIAALRIVWWPPGNTVARFPNPGRAAVHIAPVGAGLYGVDEPFTVTLPWPVADATLAGATSVDVRTPWRVEREGARRFLVEPQGTWPSHRVVKITIDAAALYPNRLVAPMAQDQIATDDGRVVVVNLTEQVMQAYQAGKLVRTMPVSTGVSPQYTTPTGHFFIWRRVKSGDMTGGTPGQPGYYRVSHVPYAQYVYHAIAIHGAYWSHAFGAPHSHGCIQLPTRVGNPRPEGVAEDAGWLWGFTHLGTPVVIRGVTPTHTALVGYPPPPPAARARIPLGPVR